MARPGAHVIALDVFARSSRSASGSPETAEVARRSGTSATPRSRVPARRLDRPRARRRRRRTRSEDFDRVLRQVHRVLPPGSAFVFSHDAPDARSQ